MPVTAAQGKAAREGFLLRRVESLSPSANGDEIRIDAIAVSYGVLPGPGGVVTAELPEVQGIRRGPHLPKIEGTGYPQRSASLLLRVPLANVIRVTMVADRAWRPDDDGLQWGMLVAGNSPEESERTADTEARRPSVCREGSQTSITGQGFRLQIGHDPLSWQLFGPEGFPVAKSGERVRQAMGVPLVPGLCFGHDWVGASLALGSGELLSGLGERGGPLTTNGQRITAEIRDAMGTGTGGTYKAVPLVHSSAGYSIFVHSPGPVEFDVGAQYAGVLGIRCPGRVLDLFFFTSLDLSKRLADYTLLTGRASQIPLWALGTWLSRCRYQNKTELLEAVSGMRENSIGCDVVHLDPSWLVRDVLNCDFQWNQERFGELGELVEELASLGVRLSLWELPYLDPESPRAIEASSEDLLVRARDGRPAEVAGTFSRDGRPRWLVDFTKQRAREWWVEMHRPLLEAGVAAFIADFGEGFPDDGVAFAATGQSQDLQWRNLYPLWYHQAVFEAIASRRDEAPFVLARSGWAGSQRCQAHWSGDAESTPTGMAATLRAGLSWALSAPGAWSHDVGGFFGGDSELGPNPALYVRWAQFGCLSPLTRFHGLTPREPWVFGEEALQIVRRFVEIRYQLLPYLRSAMLEAARIGLPMMRPMCLEEQNLTTAWHVDWQYMLGPDLLVVPVCSDIPTPTEVEIFVPSGRWVDVFSHEEFAGPTIVRRSIGLDRLPLLARCGAVIPAGPKVISTKYLTRDEWILHVWPGPNRVTEIHGTEGVYRYRPSGLSGQPCESPCDVRAVVAEEPALRAFRAVCHLPGGGLRELAILR
jgi:alpha-D-xyloside xylohydrolase